MTSGCSMTEVEKSKNSKRVAHKKKDDRQHLNLSYEVYSVNALYFLSNVVIVTDGNAPSYFHPFHTSLRVYYRADCLVSARFRMFQDKYSSGSLLSTSSESTLDCSHCTRLRSVYGCSSHAIELMQEAHRPTPRAVYILSLLAYILA